MSDPICTILISIKPEFVELIFSGEKTVELRKNFPKNLSNVTQVVIYASSPTKSIVGKASIKKVEVEKPDMLWSLLGEKTGISLDYFNKYFNGKEKGYGLVLDNVERFRKPLPLDYLRNKLDFSPPQSFMYARKELMECID